MPEYKRTQTVIDSKLQMHYLTVWLVSTMALILVGFTFYLYFRSQAGEAGGTIPRAYSRLLIGNGFFILFLSLLMGCYAVLHSHRVAGPAYRLNQCLKRLVVDDYTFVVALRKGDYMTDVADNMNALILRLRAQQEKIGRGREALGGIVKALGDGSVPKEELAKRLGEVIALLPEPTKASAGAGGSDPAAIASAPSGTPEGGAKPAEPASGTAAAPSTQA